MQVQTFECEETQAETPELSAEAMSLIEELELEGQQSLNVKSGERFPYRQMDAEEAFVYGLLCPEHVEMRKYRQGPIPLRVLQVASHAKTMFDRIEIWHKVSPSVKDPVLVGMKRNPVETWRNDPFILARWGDVLEEWPALLKSAIQVWRAKTRDGLNRLKQEAEITLKSVDDICIDGAMKFRAPSFE